MSILTIREEKDVVVVSFKDAKVLDLLPLMWIEKLKMII
jgi:hypothetical protein